MGATRLSRLHPPGEKQVTPRCRTLVGPVHISSKREWNSSNVSRPSWKSVSLSSPVKEKRSHGHSLWTHPNPTHRSQIIKKDELPSPAYSPMLISSSKTSLKPSPELRRSNLPSINYTKKEQKYNSQYKETGEGHSPGSLVYDQRTKTGKGLWNCEVKKLAGCLW